MGYENLGQVRAFLYIKHSATAQLLNAGKKFIRKAAIADSSCFPVPSQRADWHWMPDAGPAHDGIRNPFCRLAIVPSPSGCALWHSKLSTVLAELYTALATSTALTHTSRVSVFQQCGL